MRVVLIVALTVLAGCASTSVTDISKSIPPGSNDLCQITVFHTLNKALERGEITEICVVNADTAFSFNHSINGAIKKAKKKMCSCGVGYAYIQSQSTQTGMGMKGTSKVTLVGYRYK